MRSVLAAFAAAAALLPAGAAAQVRYAPQQDTLRYESLNPY